MIRSETYAPPLRQSATRLKGAGHKTAGRLYRTDDLCLEQARGLGMLKPKANKATQESGCGVTCCFTMRRAPFVGYVEMKMTRS